MTTANDVLKVAQAELGYKESPKNSNRTKYGKEYGLNGQPWCAIFVWWVFNKADASKLFYGGGKCAYCPTIADYYIAKKQTVSSGKAGDIVLFGFGHTNSQHIGIIEKKNSDGSYTCIEGNTSTGNNCNGGQVMRRTRYKSQINWIVRPKYEKVKAETETKPESVDLEKGKTYTVTANSGLNLREKPNKESKRISGIPKGVNVKAKKVKGDWVKVKYKGVKGWICAKEGKNTYIE